MVHRVLNAATYRNLARRTVAGIQEKVIEKGSRNLLSRLAHARNDKETIATWKLDLNRILHVFNVCSAIAVLLSLTDHFQTELAINTHVLVFDSHTMVSDIHRNILKGQEGTDNHCLVSDICTPFHRQMNKLLPLPRLNSGQRSQLPVDPASYIYI